MTFTKGATVKTLPRRSTPATVTPNKGVSYGISASGAVSTISSGRTIQPVQIRFTGLSASDDGSICGWVNLKTFLETTVGKGGSVSVTPDYINPPTNDTYDDLGVGATGAVTMYYDSVSANWMYGYIWDVTVNLVYVA